MEDAGEAMPRSLPRLQCRPRVGRGVPAGVRRAASQQEGPAEVWRPRRFDPLPALITLDAPSSAARPHCRHSASLPVATLCAADHDVILITRFCRSLSQFAALHSTLGDPEPGRRGTAHGSPNSAGDPYVLLRAVLPAATVTQAGALAPTAPHIKTAARGASRLRTLTQRRARRRGGAAAPLALFSLFLSPSCRLGSPAEHPSRGARRCRHCVLLVRGGVVESTKRRSGSSAPNKNASARNARRREGSHGGGHRLPEPARNRRRGRETRRLVAMAGRGNGRQLRL